MNWQDTPKAVFSSKTVKIDRNTSLVTGDAVAEMTLLRAEDGGPRSVAAELTAARGGTFQRDGARSLRRVVVLRLARAGNALYRLRPHISWRRGKT